MAKQAKVVGLIPARGGSKGIKRKNIKSLNGKPLISYTIEAALEATSIDRVIVSTDDDEIAEIAKQYGAEVPFLRPSELALDDTPDRPVYLHLIDWLVKNEGVACDTLVPLRPTTPFKNAEIINSVVDKLNSNPAFTSVKTVTKSEAVFHPYWMFKVNSTTKHTLEPFIEGIDLSKYYQRQLLPDCYRLNGLVDAIRVTTMLGNENTFGDNIGFVEIEERFAADIDTPMDFAYCEFLLKRKDF